MSTIASPTVHLAGATFYRHDMEWRDVAWEDRSGKEPFPSPGGGSREAALLVEVAVDGMFTIVHTQDAGRVEIERVIEDLQFLLEHLDQLYPEDQPRGRCLTFGDWGRCWSNAGHESEHRFPDAPADYRELLPDPEVAT